MNGLAKWISILLAIVAMVGGAVLYVANVDAKAATAVAIAQGAQKELDETKVWQDRRFDRLEGQLDEVIRYLRPFRP